jgi:hypothetical protein
MASSMRASARHARSARTSHVQNSGANSAKLCAASFPEALLGGAPLGHLWKFNSRVLPLFTGPNHWAKELNLVQIVPD